VSDPAGFYASMVPTPPQGALNVDLHARSVALMVAALMSTVSASQLIGVWANRSATVITLLLMAHFFADILYLYAAYLGVGEDYFWNPSQWHSGMWGLMITDGVFNVTRVLTVLGVFGPLGITKTKRH
jgi:hypothetical protein